MLSAYLLTVSVLTAGVHVQLSAGTITADYGQDAELSWLLPSSDVVAQVTVQKKLKTGNASPEYMATHSTRFGQEITDPYRGRVEWSASSSTSAPAITIKNVTWSDEACYICTFNVYNTGSKSQMTCLSVQGISNVRTDVQQTQPRELVVSCSATGKPTPSVRWDAAGIDNTTETTSHWVENADSTFTVSSNLTLAPPARADWVDCVVDGVSTGPRRQRISLPLLYGGTDEEVENESGNSAGIIVSLGIVIAIALVALMVWRRKKRRPFKQQNMSSSMLSLCLCEKKTRHTTREMEMEEGAEIA